MRKTKVKKTIFCVELTREEVEAIVNSLEDSIKSDESMFEIAQYGDRKLLAYFMGILEQHEINNPSI